MVVVASFDESRKPTLYSLVDGRAVFLYRRLPAAQAKRYAGSQNAGSCLHAADIVYCRD